MNIGIVIDEWKRPVFERMLTPYGWPVTAHPGPMKGTLLLKVWTTDSRGASAVIADANNECAAMKGPQ